MHAMPKFAANAASPTICPAAAVGRDLAFAIEAHRAADAARADLNPTQAIIDRLTVKLTAAPATSLTGAMAQIGLVISELDDLGEGAERAQRLLYSALSAIEAAVGVSRADVGGDYYAPERCDPKH